MFYKILLGLFILLIILFLFFFVRKSCKPHCSGAFCGSTSSDGCGGSCDCLAGGKCGSGRCCYPNCNGLNWGDDGCGGTCYCDALPFGKEQANGKCCYSQDCNGVFCGDDGCGGTCACQSGAMCSSTGGIGLCANSGTAGWTYNILQNKGMQQMNASSAQECAGWSPVSIQPTKLNFPCSSVSDCPKGDSCINGYCTKNNIYQYWIYDPENSMNCTKLIQGSKVCGIQKNSASAFNVLDNIGPDKESCTEPSCVINPVCPPTGSNACCPQDFFLLNGICYSQQGNAQCCLNTGSTPIYTECLTSLPSCENLPNNWWKGDIAEIRNGDCGMTINGPSIPINSNTLQNSSFTSPCLNKYTGDSCTYNDGSSSFTGICKGCLDGKNRCFPDSMCVSTYLSASQPGVCSNQNVCGG